MAKLGQNAHEVKDISHSFGLDDPAPHSTRTDLEGEIAKNCVLGDQNWAMFDAPSSYLFVDLSQALGQSDLCVYPHRP